MSLKFLAFLSLTTLVSFIVALPFHKANFATTLGKSDYFEGKLFYFIFTQTNFTRCWKTCPTTNNMDEVSELTGVNLVWDIRVRPKQIL